MSFQIKSDRKESENKTIRFDVVVSFDVDHNEAIGALHDEVRALYPDYDLTIVPDVDVAD